MKRMNILVAALTLTISTQASAEPFKLLRCPAVPQAYTQMITELSVLKTAIKRDAACSPVESQVSSLETLLGSRRTEVVDLIKKSKAEPLSETELALVKTYAEDVTNKVFATVQLLDRNKNCFSEDNQPLGLADFAAIALDATALAKTVAGPWAAPIALGGQAIAGVMQGIDRVIKSKRGYDFTKLEQRQSYVQSLCTYYNYRQDIENLLFPDKRVSQLRNLNVVLNTGLSNMVKNCAECRRISELANNGTKDPAAINGLANSADSAFKVPLGSITVKTLSSLSWVRGELNRIAEEMEGDANIGRDFVSEIKADIDQFMFEKEAPRFISYQNDKARALFGDYRGYVISEGRAIVDQAGELLGASQGRFYDLDEVEIVKKLAALKANPVAAKFSGLQFRIDGFEAKSTDILARTKLALKVQLTYCDFFQKAGLYNSNSIQLACENDSTVRLATALQRLEKEQITGGINLLSGDTNPSTNLQADWVEGMDNMARSLFAHPALFERRPEDFRDR